MSFARSIDFDQALKLIQKTAKNHPLAAENVPLKKAVGRWTCEDILAPLDVPAFDCSRMDGFAISFECYQSTAAKSLPLAEPIHAGKQLTAVSCGGRAVPVMTGGKMPVDATTVVIKEQAEVNEDQVVFTAPVKDAAYIRRRGSDLAAGQVVVKADTVLKTTHLGLLASVGVSQVKVKNQPHVALMMTGDELVQPGEGCEPGEIYDANSTMLQVLLEQLGCQVSLYPPLQDSKAAVEKRLQDLTAQSHDLVLSVGGVSMGDKDWIPAVLHQLGHIVFHKVKVKPGFPVLFGELGDALYFGLPGNPVSAFTCLCQFVVPAMHGLRGVRQLPVAQFHAQLAHDIEKKHDRLEFMRACLEITTDGKLQVGVAGGQQSSRIESLVEANCFVVLGAAAQVFRTGELVPIQLFSQLTGEVL